MVNKVASMACGVLVEYLNALVQQINSPSLNDKQARLCLFVFVGTFKHSDRLSSHTLWDLG
jgi:hypothetical protein